MKNPVPKMIDSMYILVSFCSPRELNTLSEMPEETNKNGGINDRPASSTPTIYFPTYDSVLEGLLSM